MKILLALCCLLFDGATANAQATGPTREQTVQFIKDYLAETAKSYTDYNENEVDFNRFEMGINSISFDYATGTMLIKYYLRFYYYRADNPKSGYRNYGDLGELQTTIINFKTCESVLLEGIRLGSHTERDKVVRMALIFHASPRKTIAGATATSATTPDDKEGWVPLEFYKCDDCNNAEVNKKILQAFNHLRKLYGAPDPISFDGK